MSEFDDAVTWLCSDEGGGPGWYGSTDESLARVLAYPRLRELLEETGRLENVSVRAVEIGPLGMWAEDYAPFDTPVFVFTVSDGEGT